MRVQLNLGCGHVQPEGWINVDGSIRCWAATRFPLIDKLLVRMKVWPSTDFNRRTKFTNLLKKLPWSDNSVDCVYLGEVLEHFTKDDGRHLLSECLRVLKPGGVFRCRVPDNERFWRNYLKEYDETRARPQDEWTLGHTRWVDMFFRDICVRRRLFKSMGHFHKYMYDEVSLILTLKAVGFTNPQRKAYLDSRIQDVKTVETHEDLTVEAEKS